MPKNFIAYINIIKKLKSKDMEFHTYEPKQERSFKVVVKYMYPSSNVIRRHQIISEKKLEIMDIQLLI